MIQKLVNILGIIFLVALLSACDPYQKLLKSSNYDLKYTKAKEFYNAGQYSKAIPLFEELMIRHKGTKEAEKLYYFYAYCYYGDEDYLFASHYFKNFLDYFPTSKFAEDAQFMIAYSFYNMSPKPSLEQTYSEKAIEAFQLFINTYPYSKKVEEGNALIDELRDKLEKKAFASAKLYYDTRNYKAAATAYKNLLQGFPDTDHKEDILFSITKSYYLLANKSIQSKKLERYNLAVDAYINFIDLYPKSKLVREAERIYDTCLTQIDKIKEKESQKQNQKQNQNG